MFRFFTLLLMGLSLLSCDGNKDDGNGGGGSGNAGVNTVRLQLSSDEVSQQIPTSSLSPFRPFAACNLSNGAINASGECITPRALKAKVTQLDLSNSFGGDNGGARLIQFNAGPEGSGHEGPMGVLGLATYDFGTTAKATNVYSEDGIPETQYYYDNVTIHLGAMEMQIDVTPDSSTPYWTIRYAFFPQNPADESAVSSCITSDPGLQNAVTTNGNLYSAPSGFQRGDILLCTKSSATAVCADSDFQFIDSTNGNLTSTRPTSPVRLTGQYLWGGENNGCSNQDSGISLQMQTGRFQTTIPSGSGVMIYKSRPGNACLFQYTFNTGCTSTSATSGSCTGTEQTGFGLDASVDFNLSESVFVENTINISSDTPATIRRNLDKVLPRPIFFENAKTVVGTGYDSGLQAAVSFVLDNSIATAALQSKGEDPNNYDSNFCFIEPDQ